MHARAKLARHSKSPASKASSKHEQPVLAPQHPAVRRCASRGNMRRMRARRPLRRRAPPAPGRDRPENPCASPARREAPAPRRLAQMLERSVETRRLGQHRDRRGAAARVGGDASQPILAVFAQMPAAGERNLSSAMTSNPLSRQTQRRRGGQACRARRSRRRRIHAHRLRHARGARACHLVQEAAHSFPIRMPRIAATAAAMPRSAAVDAGARNIDSGLRWIWARGRR
jgi:hypothetical protein